MTGWAQINGLRGDTSINERTKFDLWYSENWSVLLDVKIILRTIWQIIDRENGTRLENGKTAVPTTPASPKPDNDAASPTPLRQSVPPS